MDDGDKADGPKPGDGPMDLNRIAIHLLLSNWDLLNSHWRDIERDGE